eukprot:TRINITY_DN12112_c0_g1_i7.p2 TRINITY_DN12112_c0_g1~~TRINITY_DN12112_c0_g1_i7.p2  ORF type:complete len:261 (-),score=48.88 TRINITY_DN12112_c0_g1_i7:1016-1798(-)
MQRGLVGSEMCIRDRYNRGVVYFVPGNTNMYKAENPEILIQKIKNNFEENTKNLKDDLVKITDVNEEKKYYNLSGTNNLLNKAKELLVSAQKEVYINTCLDLKIFEQEIDMLKKKNVRIIVFTYSDINSENFEIELYKHPLKNNRYKEDNEIRLMIVVDLKHTLICSSENVNTDMNGIFTENKLLCKIVSEHIHHDIYLLKLKEKENNEIIKEDIKLNTLLENRISLDYKQLNQGNLFLQDIGIYILRNNQQCIMSIEKL